MFENPFIKRQENPADESRRLETKGAKNKPREIDPKTGAVLTPEEAEEKQKQKLEDPSRWRDFE